MEACSQVAKAPPTSSSPDATLLALELALARAHAAELSDSLAASRDTEAALRREEAALRSKLARMSSDLTCARLELSRLRGATSGAEACSPRGGGSAELASNLAARVQAAVQAQLRAERYAVSRRAACPVCYERDKDCALSCGHVYCGACAALLRRCALCRAEVTARIHLF